ncbi:hypothetical protein [uncultured Aquimarina sp.]|uniref:hypothetical protein n=1 Tax=uncultured Aquimarina sp. TaxID=575652 RepID=UPI002615FD06|nr:hypothetical protein [uncultured Aquimarina sp.]
MKNFKNRILLKLFCLSIIVTGTLSCSNDNQEEVYDQELASFEEFTIGDFEEELTIDDAEEFDENPNEVLPTKGSEILIMETIGKKTNYYITTDYGETYKKIPNEKSLDFEDNKFWAITLYSQNDFYGQSSFSLFLPDKKIKRSHNFKLNGVRYRSFVSKGNMNVRLFESSDFTGHNHFFDRKDKKPYKLNNLSHHYRSVNLWPHDSKDAKSVLYEDDNYEGAPRPIWNNVNLSDKWKTKVSSIRVNTQNWSTGNVLSSSNSDNSIVTASDMGLLPLELRDKIIEIAITNTRGKACNPRQSCHKERLCNSLISGVVGSHDVTTAAGCNKELARKGIRRNRRSFCTISGYCIDPRTLNGRN